MDNRDLFAMAALTGLCAALDYRTTGTMIDPSGLSVDAYAIADAMIIEREVRGDHDGSPSD